MSVRIPDEPLRHVLEGPRDTARVAVVRLSDGDEPGLCILVNAAGSVSLILAIEAAAMGRVFWRDEKERPITEEDRAGWKELGRRFAAAMLAGLT